jgi:very-short-patch-repair endonuclease
VTIKYYAHFLVDQPDPSGMQEYRGVVELDGQPHLGREQKEAARIIARNFGRPAQDVKVLQWARLH